MSNVEWYFHIVQKYRRELNQINAKFDAQIESKKDYAGSEGYAADVQKIEQVRAAEIAALRADCGENFNRCIQAMEKNAENRPVVAPTAEQLSVIQLLKMKEHISREELERAAHSMGDCGLALSVLEEIARSHEILGFHAGSMGVSDQLVKDSIRAFSKNARVTLSLERTNQRRELMRGDEGPYGTFPSEGNIQKFRVDVDPENAHDCAVRWGGVPGDVYEAFCKAVDGTERE